MYTDREVGLGLNKEHMRLYLHECKCRTYEPLHLSFLLSYATICYLETGFMLIHTVIDLDMAMAVLSSHS